MVPVMSLWLPILVSAVFVFLASWIMHAVLTYHHTDVRRAPSEDAVMEALGKLNIPPGDYFVPKADSMKQMGSPAFVEKMKQGPVLFMTVMPNGPPAMGASLAQWFVYCLVVGVFAAYIAGRAVGPGGDYLAVFRFAGCTAFAGYALALVQNSIWWKRSWSSTVKVLIDGLVYAFLTAGTFGWLWPR